MREKGENFSLSSPLPPFPASEQPSPAAAVLVRRPPLRRFVDEDDVVPDLLDAVPGDIELLPPAEQAENRQGPGTISAATLPSGISTSTSPTYPSRQPSQMLMTSLYRSSTILHCMAIPPWGMVCRVRIVLCLLFPKALQDFICSFGCCAGRSFPGG